MRILQVATFWLEEELNEFLMEKSETEIKEIKVTSNHGSDATDYPLGYTVIYYKEV